ncbi:restriction endonuclease subunit S [Methanococcus maripaludis]|uniref:restriction endonuclease subunit S n=1 Tax=Methanococcus maripaludis TaxID=39152 RepID=UPI003140D63C
MIAQKKYSFSEESKSFTYKKYPSYKDSGIEWIGEIPEGWEIKKLKHISKNINGYAFKSEDFSEEGTAIVRIGDIKDKFSYENVKRINLKKEYIPYSLKKNDVLIALTGATIGKSCIFDSKELAYVNQRVGVFRGTGITQKLLSYWMKTNGFLEYVGLLSSGSAQENISNSDISNFKIAQPSISEQTKIAEFLDKKTEKIDKIIEKNTELINLLKEKRISLINNAVTKGLDKDVNLKDSGIEWIGEIPESWEIHKLKYVTKINEETLPEKINNDFKIKYLDISNVDCFGNILNLEEVYYSDSPSRARRITKEKDTLVSTVRTYLRAIAYLKNIPNNLIVSTGYAVLTPLNVFYPKFLYYAILGEKFIQNVIANSKGIAYPAINSSDLGCLPIVLPPLSEQIKIAQYLDKETEKIDKIIEKIEKNIEFLKEYKTSLIHSAVTGKIDVRGE